MCRVVQVTRKKQAIRFGAIHYTANCEPPNQAQHVKQKNNGKQILLPKTLEEKNNDLRKIERSKRYGIEKSRR